MREEEERRLQEEQRRRNARYRQERADGGKQKQQRNTGSRKGTKPRRSPEEREASRARAEKAYKKAIEDAKRRFDSMNRSAKENFENDIRQNPSNLDAIEFMYQEELRNIKQSYERALAKAKRAREVGGQ